MQYQRNLDHLTANSIRMSKIALSRDFQRRLQMERVEAEIENAIKEKEDNTSIKDDNLETRFNVEMMRLKEEEQNRAKLNISLWENSLELRELKRKVQEAHNGKQLLAQINEKKKSLLEEKLHLKNFEDFMKSKLELNDELQEKNKVEANKKKIKYKEELLNQIAQSSTKQNAYKEYLMDKEMLELNLQSEKELVKREQEIRDNKLRKLKQDIEEANRFQCEYMQQKKQASDDEDKKIKEYIHQQEIKEKQKFVKTIEMENIRKQYQENLYNTFGPYLENNNEKKEREEILNYLEEEKLKEANLMREKEEMEKSIRWKKELQRIEKQQHQEKMKTIEENNLLELRYRKEFEAEAAKDGQLAQLAMEEKHQRMLEYRNQLDEQLKDKHQRKIECWQREMALKKLSEAEETLKKNLLKEERTKILTKHLPRLIGHLPNKVLCKDDLALLGPEFSTVGQIKAINPL